MDLYSGYNFGDYQVKELDRALKYFQENGINPSKEQLDILSSLANQFFYKERNDHPDDPTEQALVQMFMWGFILGTMTEHFKNYISAESIAADFGLGESGAKE